MQRYTLDTRLLKNLLQTKRFGCRLHEMDNVDSTNTKAKKLAEEGGEEGILILSKTQVQGRGRFERRWLSPEGGLYFSLVLRPKIKDPLPLTVIFGAGISMAIESQISLPCRFHWPNDLFINGKKVGGILMESKYLGENLDYVVVGVGINVNFPAELLGDDMSVIPTTIMDQRQGETTAMTALLAGILNKLEKDYDKFQEKGAESLIKRYKNRCYTLGKRIKILNSGEIKESDGYARDLTPDGGLQVELFSGGQGILYNAERLLLLDTEDDDD